MSDLQFFRSKLSHLVASPASRSSQRIPVPGISASNLPESSQTSSTDSTPSQPPLADFYPTQKAALLNKNNPLITRLLSLHVLLVRELQDSSSLILKLNPSRRQNLLKHLESLSQKNKLYRNLSQWITLDTQSPEHELLRQQTLQKYFKEIASFFIAQVLVLERWSLLKIFQFEEHCMSRLNWELSTQLKTLVPLHREGWNFTRPNLYSWFNPSSRLQSEIYQWLRDMRTQSNLNLKVDFLKDCFQSIVEQESQNDLEKQITYSSVFFQSIYDAMTPSSPSPSSSNSQELQTSLSTHVKKRFLFSPQLGHADIQSIVLNGHHEWIGYESNELNLFIHELRLLWNGPISPPLWHSGNGIGFSATQSSQLRLSIDTHSLISQQSKIPLLISEVRSCEMAWIKQNTLTTPLPKDSAHDQKHLDCQQAAAAYEQLRPGSYLIWIRQESLSTVTGVKEFKQFFKKMKLICEWSAQHLEARFELPTGLFSPFVYIFQKELNLESVHDHHPKQITLTGHIRSYIEIPRLLEESFKAELSQNLSHIKIEVEQSSLAQSEWLKSWPLDQDLTATSSLSQPTLQDWIDTHKITTTVLSECAMIRVLDKAISFEKGNMSCLVIQSRYEGADFKLKIMEPEVSLPLQKGDALIHFSTDALKQAFHVLLELPIYQKWIMNHSQKNKQKLILSSTALRLLPVPTLIVNQTHSPQTELMNLVQQIGQQRRVIAHLSGFFDQERVKLETIHFEKVLQYFPPTLQTSIAQHPLVSIEGKLPQHYPVLQINELKNCLLLTTEDGSQLRIKSNEAWILKIIFDLHKKNPLMTWHEMVLQIHLPLSWETYQQFCLDLTTEYQSKEEQWNGLSDQFQKTIANAAAHT